MSEQEYFSLMRVRYDKLRARITKFGAELLYDNFASSGANVPSINFTIGSLSEHQHLEEVQLIKNVTLNLNDGRCVVIDEKTAKLLMESLQRLFN